MAREEVPSVSVAGLLSVSESKLLTFRTGIIFARSSASHTEASILLSRGSSWLLFTPPIVLAIYLVLRIL